jgi:isopenicillin-N N-acyltransferase like protein
MHTRSLFILLAIAILASGIAAATKKKAPPPASPPVPIIELAGTPEEIGRQHAEKLAPQVHELHEKYLKPWFKDPILRGAGQLAAGLFRNQLLPEHRAELDSMAAALQLSPADVMLGSCFLDLIPITACSTVALPAEAAADGVARFGRNLDFPGMNIAEKHSILLIVRPEGRYSYAAVTWPGMLGVLSGMNEHGLTLANMEVKRTGALPQAMPYTLLYRTVLERSRTVDEAIQLLEQTPRQTANNLMLMDAQGNRAVVEIQREGITVRRGQPGAALISTNHQRGQDHDTARHCWRYDSLHRESARLFGRTDVRSIERLLDEVSQGKMTMQSMVFEPSTRVIHLAAGEQASKLAFHRIDLKPHFTGQAQPASAP